MPNSTSDLDGTVKSFIKEYPCRMYMDIGCGSGKYASIIRQLIPDAHITGIEISAEYIERFGLDKLYDKVINIDAVSIASSSGYYTETAIIGDMLEHMRKSDGIDLVNYMLYRCRYLLAIVPDSRLQYSPDNPNEEHRSLWRLSDFTDFVFHEEHVAGKSFYALAGLLSSDTTYAPPDALEILEKHSIKIGK